MSAGPAAEVPAGAAAAAASAPVAAFTAPRWGPAARFAALALGDAAALVASVAIGWLAWAGPVLDQPAAMYLDLLPLAAVFVVGYARAGLYPGFGLGAVETLRRLTVRTTFVFVVLAAAAFALKLPPRYSRLTITVAWAASLVAVPLLRYLLLGVLSRRSWWGEPTVLVGRGPRLERVVELLWAAVSLGYRPVAVLAPKAPREADSAAGVPVVGGLERAAELAAAGARTAIVAGAAGHQWPALAAALRAHFRHVVLLMDSDELPVESVAVRNLGGVLGIELANNALLPGNRAVKRCLDLALGAVSLLLAAPVIAAGAALIRLRDRGPAFFVQEREGRGGAPIRVWKLRTMYVDAEGRLEEHLRASPAARREWESRCKLADDPRVVPGVGVLLRRLSIDELPQLWSVVSGEMSLVGPRPFPSYHTERLPAEFRALRRSVRPGLTGLWQVLVRGDGDLDDQVHLDTYYIRNWSVWMDLYILAKTLAVVVTGRGAY